jgi:hypothetical protein
LYEESRHRFRRARIPELLVLHDISPWARGTPRRLAALLDVSQETARLDILAVLDEARKRRRCLCCGSAIVPALRVSAGP